MNVHCFVLEPRSGRMSQSRGAESAHRDIPPQSGKTEKGSGRTCAERQVRNSADQALASV